jgi:hypothetical protein
MKWALLGLVLALPVTAARADDSSGYSVPATAADRARILAGDEAAWKPASAVAWGPAPYETRFRALWSQGGLYLRYDVDDASPWHTMTHRDEHIWQEEVVEIFLDADRSGHDYYELEISPANVVCDLRMIDASPWKGDFKFDLEGLETRVAARKAGTGQTTGWTATAFLPWKGLRALPSAARVTTPPKPGDRWRFNVFRIERPGGKENPEKDPVEAAWSKPTADTFHDPSVFRDMVFLAAAR